MRVRLWIMFVGATIALHPLRAAAQQHAPTDTVPPQDTLPARFDSLTVAFLDSANVRIDPSAYEAIRVFAVEGARALVAAQAPTTKVINAERDLTSVLSQLVIQAPTASIYNPEIGRRERLPIVSQASVAQVTESRCYWPWPPCN